MILVVKRLTVIKYYISYQYLSIIVCYRTFLFLLEMYTYDIYILLFFTTDNADNI